MTYLIWNLFEIIINFYQGFMEIYFINNVLSAKSDAHIKRNSIIFSSVMGLLITVLNQITLFEGIAGMAVYWGLLIIYALLHFKDKIVKCVFVSIVPLVLLALISLTSINFISSLNNMKIDELVLSTGSPRVILLLLTQFLFFVVLKILIKLFSRNENEFQNIELLTIIFVLCMSVVLASFLYIISTRNASTNQQSIINYSIAFLIIIIIAIFIIINMIKKKNIQINNYKLEKLHGEYQKLYVEEARTQYDTISKLRHDLKNQWLAVYRLIEENKSDEAAEYIRENISIIKSVEPKLFTQNEIVNAVVNSKLSFASAMGIEVSCFSTNDFSGVSNIDWCNLLSNMLDNAVEACLGISGDIDRHIELTISKSDNTYTIIISNTIENSVLAYNPNLRSTKHNSENHGMGTKIIKDIVSKHNGTCLFYENNNEFNCKAILQV